MQSNQKLRKACPSGRLVETWASNSLSSPAIVNAAGNTPTFTNAREIHKGGIVVDSQFNTDYALVQQENIYVGYKYYETRYFDAVTGNGNAAGNAGSSFAGGWKYENEVTYPFGFGLSYTSFSQKITDVKKNSDNNYTLSVSVENTGMVAGKCVIEVYAQTPYGAYEKQNGVEKSAVQLVAFDKTATLQPNEVYKTKIDVNGYFLASYDENNAKGYILSAGDYYFILGDDAHDAVNRVLAAQGFTNLRDQNGNAVDYDGNAERVYAFRENSLNSEIYAYGENGERVTNRFDNCDINYWEGNSVKYLTRTNWEETFPQTAASVKASGEEMLTLLQGDFYKKAEDAPSASSITQEANNGISFVMMKDADYDDKDIWNQFLDQFSIDELAALTANYFGSREIPSVVLPQLPAGDGCDSVGEQKFSQEFSDGRGACLYSGLLSATWNKELLANRGKMMANEGLFFGFSEIWTGGGNLRRTPFGGRNGEYYSEDGNLVYMMSSIELPEMDKRGVLGGIKHFAGNDQESHREGVNTFYTEQSFRENALRGFEGVLREEKCLAVMQAFNRQGVVWSSASSELNIGVLREEWGFGGHVITDATFGNKFGFRSHYATTMMAGTDVYCLDSGNVCGSRIAERIREDDDGNLLLRLRESAKNTVYAFSRTCALNGLKSGDVIVQITPAWLIAVYVADGLVWAVTLAAIALFIATMPKKKAISDDNAEAGTESKNGKESDVSPLLPRILSAVASVLCAAAFMAIWVYYSKLLSFYAPVVILYVAALAGNIAAVFLPNKYLSASGCFLTAAAWSAFLCNSEVLGSFADKLQGIVMFGHREFVPLIITVAALAAVALILAAVRSFYLSRIKE